MNLYILLNNKIKIYFQNTNYLTVEHFTSKINGSNIRESMKGYRTPHDSAVAWLVLRSDTHNYRINSWTPYIAHACFTSNCSKINAQARANTNRRNWTYPNDWLLDSVACATGTSRGSRFRIGSWCRTVVPPLNLYNIAQHSLYWWWPCTLLTKLCS